MRPVVAAPFAAAFSRHSAAMLAVLAVVAVLSDAQLPRAAADGNFAACASSDPVCSGSNVQTSTGPGGSSYCCAGNAHCSISTIYNGDGSTTNTCSSGCTACSGTPPAEHGQAMPPFQPNTFAILSPGQSLLLPPACPSGYDMQYDTIMVYFQDSVQYAVAFDYSSMPTSVGPSRTDAFAVGFRDRRQNAPPIYYRITCKSAAGCAITTAIMFYCQMPSGAYPVQADESCSTGLAINRNTEYTCIAPNDSQLSWNFGASLSPGASHAWNVWKAPSAGATACQFSTTCSSGTCTVPFGFTNLFISCSNGATPVTNAPTCYCLPTAVNGHWSAWSTCSATCGGGTQTRTCSDSAAANEGATCIGVSQQSCNTQSCSSGGAPAPVQPTGTSCRCSCCSGYGCTASLVGYAPAVSCSGTDCDVQCRAAFSSCPSAGANGIVSSFCSTSSGSGDSTYSWVTGDWSTCSATCGGGTQTRSVRCASNSGVTASDSSCATSSAGAKLTTTQACNSDTCASNAASLWLGDYAPSGCDQSACCCFSTVTISKMANGAYQVGGWLAGQCGGLSTAQVSLGAAPTSSTGTATYTANGQTHTAVRNSDGSITDTNHDDGRCSARLTPSNSDSDSDSNSKLAIGLMVGVAVGAGVVLLGIAAGIFYYCCRRKQAQPNGHAASKVAPHPGSAQTNAARVYMDSGESAQQTYTIAVRSGSN